MILTYLLVAVISIPTNYILSYKLKKNTTMKELLITLSLSFSADFNVELPKIEFVITSLDSLYGKAEKKDSIWFIYIDNTIRNTQRLKSLVYHELGHVIFNLQDSDTKDFMNPIYSVKRYNRRLIPKQLL